MSKSVSIFVFHNQKDKIQATHGNIDLSINFIEKYWRFVWTKKKSPTDMHLRQYRTYLDKTAYETI